MQEAGRSPAGLGCGAPVVSTGQLGGYQGSLFYQAACESMRWESIGFLPKQCRELLGKKEVQSRGSTCFGITLPLLN